MNINLIMKTAEKLVVDNTPTILTAVGSVGAVTSTILAARAGAKAQQDLALFRLENVRDELKPEEKFKIVWRRYVPAVGTCALTVGAVVGANRISASRAVALGAAYLLTQEKHEEYKKKVTQSINSRLKNEIDEKIAQEGVDKNPPKTNQIIFLGSGEVMFKDSWSGRYFMSDMETVRKAVNDVNYEVRTGSYCSLTSFYNMIGLDGTFDSDEIGWNDDTQLDVTFTTALHDGKPIIVFDFDVIPIRGYYNGHA